MEYQFSFNVRMLVLLGAALLLALGLSFALGVLVGAESTGPSSQASPQPVVKSVNR